MANSFHFCAERLFREIIAGKLNFKLLVPSSFSFSSFWAPNVPNVTFENGTTCFNICQKAHMQANKILLPINRQLLIVRMQLQLKGIGFKYFI